MKFENLQPTSRGEAVRDQLLEAMGQSELRPGDRLPSESELSQQFGVSRVSVREALRGLETMGLLEIQHGRGSFVAHGPGQRYRRPFSSWLDLHREEVGDLMKVRGALDELAASEAAETQDAGGIELLSEIHEQFLAAAEDAENVMVERLVQLDIQFHNHIAEMGGSAVLPHLLADLNKLFTDVRRATFSMPDRAKQSAKEHSLIVAAIRSADAAAARAAAATHLSSARGSLDDPRLGPEAALEQTGAEPKGP